MSTNKIELGINIKPNDFKERMIGLEKEIITMNKIDEIKKEAREEFIEDMTAVIGDRINDLLEYRGIIDCGKSMRGGCDEIVMPIIADWWLSKLDSAISVCETECQAKIVEAVKARDEWWLDNFRYFNNGCGCCADETIEERYQNLIKSSESGQNK